MSDLVTTAPRTLAERLALMARRQAEELRIEDMSPDDEVLPNGPKPPPITDEGRAWFRSCKLITQSNAKVRRLPPIRVSEVLFGVDLMDAAVLKSEFSARSVALNASAKGFVTEWIFVLPKYTVFDNSPLRKHALVTDDFRPGVLFALRKLSTRDVAKRAGITSNDVQRTISGLGDIRIASKALAAIGVDLHISLTNLRGEQFILDPSAYRIGSKNSTLNNEVSIISRGPQAILDEVGFFDLMQAIIAPAPPSYNMIHKLQYYAKNAGFTLGLCAQLKGGPWVNLPNVKQANFRAFMMMYMGAVRAADAIPSLRLLKDISLFETFMADYVEDYCWSWHRAGNESTLYFRRFSDKGVVAPQTASKNSKPTPKINPPIQIPAGSGPALNLESLVIDADLPKAPMSEQVYKGKVQRFMTRISRYTKENKKKLVVLVGSKRRGWVIVPAANPQKISVAVKMIMNDDQDIALTCHKALRRSDISDLRAFLTRHKLALALCYEGPEGKAWYDLPRKNGRQSSERATPRKSKQLLGVTPEV